MASSPRLLAAGKIELKQKSKERSWTVNVPLRYENRDRECVIMGSLSRVIAPKFNLDNLRGTFRNP